MRVRFEVFGVAGTPAGDHAQHVVAPAGVLDRGILKLFESRSQARGSHLEQGRTSGVRVGHASFRRPGPERKAQITDRAVGTVSAPVYVKSPPLGRLRQSAGASFG